MIADLRPYLVGYKESGMAWLGRVPGYWHLRALRHVTRPTKGKQPKQLFAEQEAPTGAIPYLTMEYLRRHTGRAKVYCTPDDGLVTAARGEVLLLWDGANAGEFFMAKGGVVSSTAALLRTTEHDRRYLYFMLKQCEPRLRALSTGMGIPHVDGAILKQMQICVPPPDEQAAIVRFLDWADGRLGRAIRAKRKVIALLNEQKQAIIHRAVTRGVDPSVPLKPSGVPWLGDIPQHWEVERTKNVFRLRTQKSGLAHGKELLSIYTHIGVRPRKDLEQKGNRASTTDNYWIVRKGDLIVNKLLAWMGAVGSSDYEGVTSPAYDILMPIRPLCSDYYHHLFRTKLYLQMFKQRSRGIMDMRLRLYFDQLGQVPVPVPPVEEQASILAFCQQETAGISAAISRLEREIELLREYRTRLVADVVTGKLDVREASARLPDEVQLDTIEDEAELGDEAAPADEEAAV